MSTTPSSKLTPGARFRAALEANRPLPILGTINAYTAMMAERVGHHAIYLSGGGVANASFGLPDLGMTTMNDVVEDAHRICGATDLPLLVDIDTGWGGAFNIARTVKEMQRAGVAAVHLEDQVAQKRCGHRPNKAIVSQQEMVDRVRKSVELEINYAKDCLPNGVMGLNGDLFREYVQYVADRRLERIGLPAQYGSSNPFPWMSETMDLAKEKNFFETRVTEYQSGAALSWDD